MTKRLPSIDQLLQAIADAVVVTDAGGRVLHLNPAATAARRHLPAAGGRAPGARGRAGRHGLFYPATTVSA
jgi:hypothetical protein